MAIAEGDVLVLSISMYLFSGMLPGRHRLTFFFLELATEMLQGHYSVPAPKDSDSLLARHEAGLFEESRVGHVACRYQMGKDPVAVDIRIANANSISKRSTFECQKLELQFARSKSSAR